MVQTSNIILLVGKSGTGKTTVAEIAEKRFGKKQVISHTTRPRRYEEETGHYFVTPEEFDGIRDDLVAYTKFDGNEYGATQQVVDQSDIYVIDPDGVRYFLNTYSGIKKPVCVILTADEETCARRMLRRGDAQADVRRRIKHDETAFSDLDFDCLTVKVDVSRVDAESVAEALVRSFLMDSALADTTIPGKCAGILYRISRSIYKPGTRIRVMEMNDPYNPVPHDTTATVETVDGMGQLWCSWDDVSCGLAVIPGIDLIEIIEEACK